MSQENDNAIVLDAIPQTMVPANQRTKQELEADIPIWENTSEYQQLCLEIHSQYPSETAVERHIVNQICQVIWRQRRVSQMESASFATKYKEAKETSPYSDSPADVAFAILDGDKLQKELLKALKTEEEKDAIWDLALAYCKSVLPLLNHDKFKSALAYDEESDYVAKARKDTKRYAKLKADVFKITPNLEHFWIEALKNEHSNRIYFLQTEAENGFLAPNWDDAWSSAYWDDEETVYENDTWKWEDNALEFAIFCLDGVLHHLTRWQTELVKHKVVADLAPQATRIERGLIFPKHDMEALSKYEAHLTKQLAELLNQYFTLINLRAKKQSSI